MAGFEPRISGVGSDHFANCASDYLFKRSLQPSIFVKHSTATKKSFKLKNLGPTRIEWANSFSENLKLGGNSAAFEPGNSRKKIEWQMISQRLKARTCVRKQKKLEKSKKSELGPKVSFKSKKIEKKTKRRQLDFGGSFPNVRAGTAWQRQLWQLAKEAQQNFFFFFFFL